MPIDAFVGDVEVRAITIEQLPQLRRGELRLRVSLARDAGQPRHDWHLGARLRIVQ